MVSSVVGCSVLFGMIGEFSVLNQLPLLFSSFYAAALVLELFRIRLNNRNLKTASFGVLAGGLAVHTLWLFGFLVPQNLCPVVSAGGWFFVLAWGLVLCDVVLFFRYPKTSFGVLFLPAVLLAIPAGIVLTDKQVQVSAAGQTLGAIHGTSLLITTLLLLFGFVTGVMFFLQRAKMKSRNGFLRGFSLPSLEWLRKMNRRSVSFSLFFLACGVFSGLILRRVSASSSEELMRDLMVLGAIFLFILLGGVLLTLNRTDQNKSDVRIAGLSILSFVILTVILGYGILDSRAHWLFSSGGENDNIETLRDVNGEERLP